MTVDRQLTMASIGTVALSIILHVPDKADETLSLRQYQSSVHIQLLLKTQGVMIY